jgi:AcrR family transcriptional regulator
MDHAETASPTALFSPIPGRRSRTRSRILLASDELFTERGYEPVTMHEIAAAAGVAVRTLYLHFPSKASMLLAYFDDWLEDLVATISARPIDEPIADAAAAALGALSADGWVDRAPAAAATPHPTAELIAAGPPELAGHVLHSWSSAMDRIAGARGGDLAARADAAALMGSWVATLLAARSLAGDGGASAMTGNDLGVQILRAMTARP